MIKPQKRIQITQRTQLLQNNPNKKMKTFSYIINNVKYDVQIQSIEGQVAQVNVNGKDYTVELENPISDPEPKRAAPKSEPISKSEPTPKATPAPEVAPVSVSAPAPATTPSGAGVPLTSPLPGVILSVLVNPGDVVKKGQKVIVLEAMKMENDIKAQKDGTVTSVLVQKGDSVQEGDVLLKLG